ncbi:glycogen synthase GlgA [Heliophilum fasciatum]|uniref:Glycogen synthase n=1 Tax=Heliophilum fasciatum TaxID=35700 RepID=A0A4R2RW13_9FIRM|nr:glycogen synthase GlgA [Heliophilum fasciatum]MCW2276920.1 starch synthase [Heliophilum fasciatum]TCP68620.1 glycogen synthase (ADP-glucose) [Heliophilum fasciatum]
MTALPKKVLFVATEVVPFAQTGGLADVAGSLPQALAALGVDVRIVMPRYMQIEKGTYLADFPVIMGERVETAIIRQGTMENRLHPESGPITVYFVDCYQFFQRPGIYGYADDGARWGFFSRALLEMIAAVGIFPDILHLNDWQLGLVPLMLKTEFRNKSRYANIGTLLTIHNLQYQGLFGMEILHQFGISPAWFTLEALEFYGQVNFLKAGILFSDYVNTVSRTYAREVQTIEYGERLEGVLRKRSQDFSGIVNGIDVRRFDPTSDPYISHHYSAENLRPKALNKTALQQEMRLPVASVPLYGLVSRLVDQKGLDLIVEIADELLRDDVQLVFLGQGDPRYENWIHDLEYRYPQKVAAHIGFNSALAQRIYAGSDFFLMPSRFEPCGLGQLIGLRYGTIPIVRATGGLADTVIDIDVDSDQGTGFVFEAYEAQVLLSTLRRSLRCYRDSSRWLKLVQRALQVNFSWDRSAREYVELYDKIAKKYGYDK